MKLFAAAVLLASSVSVAVAECEWPEHNVIRFFDYAAGDGMQGHAGTFRFELDTGLQTASRYLLSLGFKNNDGLASDPKYSTNAARLFRVGSLTPQESHFQFSNDPNLLVLLDGAVRNDQTVLSRVYLDLQRYNPDLAPDPLTDTFKLDDNSYTELSGINIVAAYIALAIFVKHDVKTAECHLLASLLLDKAGEILSTLMSAPNPSPSIGQLMATVEAVKAEP